jgi:O-acetylhomoserine/O-acetylserine sulfhydrylase-like pyridoxal-dependent enzyme
MRAEKRVAAVSAGPFAAAVSAGMCAFLIEQ